MMKETPNPYSNFYRTLSTQELKEIISKPDAYQDLARLAAYQELENREQELSNAYKEEKNLLENKLVKLQEQQKAKEDTVQKLIRELYSPMSIMGFSIFFSLLFGAVLMAINLRSIGKKVEALVTLLVSISLFGLGSYLVQLLGYMQWGALFINIVGGIILIEYFWKKHIGPDTDYKRKPIGKAIFFSILFLIGITVLYLYYNPELLEQLKQR